MPLYSALWNIAAALFPSATSGAKNWIADQKVQSLLQGRFFAEHLLVRRHLQLRAKPPSDKLIVSTTFATQLRNLVSSDAQLRPAQSSHAPISIALFDLASFFTGCLLGACVASMLCRNAAAATNGRSKTCGCTPCAHYGRSHFL